MASPAAATRPELLIRRRAEQGTRRVRRLRREGAVPGVVYGREFEPLAVMVPQRALTRFLHAKTGEHALVTLRLEDLPAPARSASQSEAAGAQAGGRSWEKPAIVQALQHHPVDGQVIHVDFHVVVLTERLKVKVPLVLKGEAVGVKQEGGILEQFLREVEVECLPADIPASVEYDVSAMKIGETIHVRDLTPARNTTITSDPEGAIASVQAPKAERAEEPAAVTEPEVIREKKEEGEEAPEEASRGETPSRHEPGEGRADEPKKPETKKDTRA